MANHYLLNYVFQKPDEKDYQYFGPSRGILPQEVDLRPEWGDIYDQGSLGSCVANSIAGCLRHIVAKQNDKPLSPSRLYVYYYTRTQPGYDVRVDSGVYIRDAFKAVNKYKVCKEETWPYDISKFDQEPIRAAQEEAKRFRTFVYLTLSPSQLKQCLAEGYPVSFGAHIYSSFDRDPYGRPGYVPMPEPYDQFQGGHCITLVGYNDNTRNYIFANSWSKNWGENGFGYIPYAYVHNPQLASDFQTCRFFRSIDRNLIMNENAATPFGNNTLVSPSCGKSCPDQNDNELVRIACNNKVVAHVVDNYVNSQSKDNPQTCDNEQENSYRFD